MKNVLYICIGALFAVLAFGSCNDAIDIRQDYDFSLSSWYLQEQIETGETVEIRFYLDREGDYEKAEYEIGYIQMEGKGEVTDSEGVRLVNREVRPLAEVRNWIGKIRSGRYSPSFTVRQVPDARN